MRRPAAWRPLLLALLLALMLPASASVAHALPVIPYHFAVYLDDFGRVQCNWGEGTDVASYAIYRAMGYQAPLPGEAEPIWQGPSDASSFLDTEVLLPGRYAYRLVAFGADGAYDSKADGVVIGDNVFGTVVGPAGQPLPGIEVAMFPRALQIDPSVVPALTLVTDSAGASAVGSTAAATICVPRPSRDSHGGVVRGALPRYNDYIHIYGDDAMVFPEVQLDRKTMRVGNRHVELHPAAACRRTSASPATQARHEPTGWNVHSTRHGDSHCRRRHLHDAAGRR